MLLVYLGSTLYHAWPRGAIKSVFQVIDHSAIFLLIAGTYTPFTLGPLRGAWGWTILGLVWATGDFRGDPEKRPRNRAAAETFHGALLGNGLADSDRVPAPAHACAAPQPGLAGSRRRCLYRREFIFFVSKRSPLHSLRLALVCPPRARACHFIAIFCLRLRMKTSPNDTLPVEHNDPINARILAISEDKIAGFVREPFAEIAGRAGLPVETVLERIVAMLRAGTVRRVRQTLLATNLADGALVAWKVPPEKIDAAFDWMSQRDPFSGHVVVAFDRCGHAGFGIQTLDNPESAARVFRCRSMARLLSADGRRGTIPAHAGERNFHVRRRPRSAKNDRARQQSRTTRQNDRRRSRRS